MSLPPLPEFLPSNLSLAEAWARIEPSFPPQLRRHFDDLLRKAIRECSADVTLDKYA